MQVQRPTWDLTVRPRLTWLTGRWMWLVLAAYLALVLGLTLSLHVFPTPDVLLAFGAILALATRRVRDFTRDWVPLLLIFLAWEASRSLTSLTGFAVHSDGVIIAERFLLAGTTAPEALQAALRSPGALSALDVSMTIIYFAHFVVPFAVALGFWFADRSWFLRYVITLFAMSVAQLTFALLVPVAPPRFSAAYGAISLSVTDVTAEVTTEMGWLVSWAYQNLGGNLVSAFPSLHAAYPVLAALFIAERSRRLAAILLVYSGVVWFATIYTGHHYLIDAIGGGLLAVIAYAIARRVPTGRRV